MAFQEQIDKLVAKLTDLTEQDKVAWEETADEDTFLASVGKFVVTVGKGEGPDEYCDYRFRILDDRGRTVDEAVATLSQPGPSEPLDQDRKRLRTLLELARRSALHSDKVVSDLLTSLQQIR